MHVVQGRISKIASSRSPWVTLYIRAYYYSYRTRALYLIVIVYVLYRRRGRRGRRVVAQVYLHRVYA